MSAREEWLAARRQGIGGSDVAGILGLSKWKTPLEIYQDKIGEGVETPDNESMLWGRALEPVIRQQYADRTGRVVLQPAEILHHPKHPFMLANLDGYTQDSRVLEIKTARSAQGWGEPGGDEIPQEYLLQVQHYMAVTTFPVADVAVLISGSDFRLYEIAADTELQEMLIEAEAEFWRRVESRTPPEPVSYADMKARFGRQSKDGIVEATPEVLAAVEKLRDVKAKLKLLESTQEDCEAIIMGALRESDTLTHKGATVATWKASKPVQRFDSKALQAANPDLYTQFLKIGEPSRRLILK